MSEQQAASAATTGPAGPARTAPAWREALREQALRNAMRKRADGVPTYTVPEAAALLSISQEYLYRLIKTDAFPAVRMRIGRAQGRFVVPAKAVEQLLEAAAEAGGCVESAGAASRTGVIAPAGSA